MQGAYRAIANANPISYLVEGLRNLVIDGLEPKYVAQALLIPVAIGIVSIAIALRALAGRLAAR
jgi:ABC-2 type transport system permease protein